MARLAVRVVDSLPERSPIRMAFEIAISAPEIDRPGIYAAMKGAEVWRFSGE